MLPILGAQFEGALGTRDRWLVPNRVYHFNLRWDEIEEQEGVHHYTEWMFDNIARLDAALGHDNYRLIIGVKCCPTFYSIPPHARNSPPAPQYYDNFARFCESVCQVFNPWGIELWNEPEFSVLESAKNAEYYGGFGLDGAAYGQMVHTIYYALKGKCSIIAGASFGLVNADRALQFLQDAVMAGMVSDYYSWHAYWKYSDIIYGQRDYYQALWYADKAHEIYHVPQIISETSIRRDTHRPELEAHRQSQADLLQFYLKYMPGSPIESVLWYALADNMWEHTDMVNGYVEHPVYQVWRQG